MQKWKCMDESTILSNKTQTHKMVILGQKCMVEPVVNVLCFSLGLVSDDPIDKRGTPIDTLSNYLAKRLTYGT